MIEWNKVKENLAAALSSDEEEMNRQLADWQNEQEDNDMSTQDLFNAAKNKPAFVPDDRPPIEEGIYDATISAFLFRTGTNSKGKEVQKLKMIFSTDDDKGNPLNLYSRNFTFCFYEQAALYKALKKIKFDFEKCDPSTLLGSNVTVSVTHSDDGLYINAEIVGKSKETGILTTKPELYIKPSSWEHFDIAQGFTNKYTEK